MADAITNTLVQCAIGTPFTEAYQEIKYALLDFKDDVVSLQRTKTTIEAAFLDADSLVEQSHTQRDTSEKLRCELDRLIDFLAARNAKATRRQVMGGSRFIKEARLFFSPSNQVVARFLDARKVKDIMNNLDAIARDYAQIGSIVCVPTVKQTQVLSVRTASTQIITTDVVIGRDEDRDNIIRSIISNHSGNENSQATSETLSVTSIVGIGGIGKTSLARYVYDNDDVKRNFDVQFWVEVTRDFDVKEILKQILATLMNDEKLGSHMEYHQPYQYHDFIRAIGGKKFLLVLDNIWDQPDTRLKWLPLRRLLEEGAYGSKVLITTRNEKVAGIMDSENPYILQDLIEGDSLSLFQQIAITRWHEPGVEKIGKDIVRMCPKVPLVIRSIGSLLAGKHTVQEWQAFRDDQWANFSSYGRDIIQSLKLSYDQLDTRLRLCVNYCTLIPKGEDFNKNDMIHRWIALEYVEPFYRNQSLEEAGEEYMKILINNGFLRQTYTGCKMHNVMYDVVLSLVGSQYKLVDSSTCEFDSNVRHVSFNVPENPSLWEVPSSVLEMRHLQSVIMVNWSRKSSDIKVKNWGSCYKLISKFHCLSVLDLCGLGIKELPKSLGELMSLRFLNLSSTNLVILPNSITRLVNLQSLYLQGCSELQELPKDMSKLVKLRHLKLEYGYILPKWTQMPSGLGKLTDLRTLDVFIVSDTRNKHIGKLADLHKLNNLEGSLTIDVNMVSKDIVLEAKEANLKMKEKLKVFHVGFGHGTKEDEMVLEGLQPPADLRELKVYSYGGERFPFWMIDQLNTYLPNLVDISVIYCRSCRYVCSMGRLRHLKTLYLGKLENVEYIENINNGTHETLLQTPLFPSLEELYIYELPKLKGWWRISSSGDDVEENQLVTWEPAFPKLKKLYVSFMEFAIAISGPPLGGFTSLQFLQIFESIADQTPQRPQALIPLSKIFPNLKHIRFYNCEGLQAVSEEIRGLTSLEKLEFCYCRQLEGIPEWIESLTSLVTLEIYECPILAEKCHETTGECWPYIQHIPRVNINP